MDKLGVTILEHLHHLAHHEIFCAKVGKDGIKDYGINIKEQAILGFCL